jgi:tetratricopeptide (TPR) repeat protein
VLITSRNPRWRELTAAVPVDLFNPNESVNLLVQRVPQLSAPDAVRIAEAVDNLPLAVAQAGAYLDQTGMSADEYLQFLDTRAAELLAVEPPPGYSVSLAASWQVAFDRLATDEPAALELLALCAQLAPEPIPFTLFTAHSDALPGPIAAVVGDPLTFLRITRLLRNRSLALVETDSVQLHRLVQAILRSRLAYEAKSEMGFAAVRLLRAAVPSEPWANRAAWPEWSRLLPHVLTATDPSSDLNCEDGDVAWLLDQAAAYLLARGEPAAALPIGQRALELRRRVLGEDDPDTLRSANSHATNLRELGEYEVACQLDEDTLARRRRVLGEDHRDTLLSANGLATDLRKLGKYKLACELDVDTLTRSRQVLGEDDRDTFMFANSLATDLRKLGRHKVACQLDKDTLARSRRVLGEDHPQTLTSAHNLAADLRRLGQHEVARPLDEDTLARRRRVLGEDHRDTLISANNLAIDLRDLGQHEMARQLDEDTLARRRRVLGEDHRDPHLGQPPCRRPARAGPARGSPPARRGHRDSPPCLWQLIGPDNARGWWSG